MLGHRGCRLGVSYPEIYEMQVRAIIEAACEVARRRQGRAVPGDHASRSSAKGEEMKFLRELTDRTAEQVMAEKGREIEYMVGTMIELPRAAIRAADLAENAEFFSFGTNDLTQTTFGISRDDSGRFLPAYMDKGIFENDPFVTLDQEGVGDLIRIAAERGRAARPDVKLGICGEHGGDPASIAVLRDASASTTSAARPTASPSPAWRRPRPPSASARRTARRQLLGCRATSSRDPGVDLGKALGADLGAVVDTRERDLYLALRVRRDVLCCVGLKLASHLEVIG